MLQLPQINMTCLWLVSYKLTFVKLFTMYAFNINHRSSDLQSIASV